MDLKQVERKHKRELRRQKQREANVGRAEKMHNQRMNSSEVITLNKDLPALNIGCSGWFYWHWRGTFYPQDMPTAEWFNCKDLDLI